MLSPVGGVDGLVRLAYEALRTDAHGATGLDLGRMPPMPVAGVRRDATGTIADSMITPPESFDAPCRRSTKRDRHLARSEARAVTPPTASSTMKA
mgnify:CR=1 FL=1